MGKRKQDRETRVAKNGVEDDAEDSGEEVEFLCATTNEMLTASGFRHS